MTKRLEDVLGLPDSNQMLLNEKKYVREAEDELRILDEDLSRDEIKEKFEKITEDLPVAAGLGTAADKELDKIAQKAMSSYEDLMDLGMNIEMRHSARIFEVAGNMLRTSLDAKVAKVNKKLKMLELQMKKEKMDKDTSDGDVINSNGQIVADRNAILEQLKGLKKDK
jgi:hypothetical protein